MPRIDLAETIKGITFSDEIWEWLDLLADVVTITKTEALAHEDFRGHTPYRKLLVSGTNKDLGTLDAIYVLLHFELVHQASALVRLFCEGLITLRYISLNPAALPVQFLAYETIEAYERASALLDLERGRANPGVVTRTEAFRTKLKPEYDRLKPIYTFLNGRGKRRPYRNWCNKSVADQAKECGGDLVRLYRLVHRQLSAYVHGSPWSLRAQLACSRIHYRGDVVLNHIATIVRVTIVVWSEFAKFWDAQLGFNLTPSISRIAGRLAKLDAKHFPAGGKAARQQQAAAAPRTRRGKREGNKWSMRRAPPADGRDHGRGRLVLEGREIVFRSVDEFIASMREELPLLRAGETIARAFGEKKRLAEAQRLIAFLGDTEALRKKMEAAAGPDGSVRFKFTPDEWVRFKECKRTGRL